jgi:hypothetical protein
VEEPAVALALALALGFAFEFRCHSDRNVRAGAKVQRRNLRLPLLLPLLLLLNFGVIPTGVRSRSEGTQWRSLLLPLPLPLPLVLLSLFGVIPTGTFALARMCSGGTCFCRCRCLSNLDLRPQGASIAPGRWRLQPPQ